MPKKARRMSRQNLNNVVSICDPEGLESFFDPMPSSSRSHINERKRDSTQLKYKKNVTARTPGQQLALDALENCTLSALLGPAGTGKTYLAVAKGVEMLSRGMVDRLILSRPAVEAGERLGYLPGDMKEKVDPYMQPLYDALYDRMDTRRVQALIQHKVIEIAPLAFMRGRTLSNAFILLDEAQNATRTQLKMYLTRLGEGSRIVMTGDPQQSDLKPGESGLQQIVEDIDGIEDCGVVRMGRGDVVRHPLVARLLEVL